MSWNSKIEHKIRTIIFTQKAAAATDVDDWYTTCTYNYCLYVQYTHKYAICRPKSYDLDDLTTMYMCIVHIHISSYRFTNSSIDYESCTATHADLLKMCLHLHWRKLKEGERECQSIFLPFASKEPQFKKRDTEILHEMLSKCKSTSIPNIIERLTTITSITNSEIEIYKTVGLKIYKLIYFLYFITISNTLDVPMIAQSVYWAFVCDGDPIQSIFFIENSTIAFLMTKWS